MSKVTSIPQLRFPEFSGEWKEKKLSDVAEIVGGGTPPTAVEKYWGGDIQWFTPTEIKNKYIVNSKRTITQVGLDTSSARLLPKGTLLFSSRATVGEIGIAVQECTTNQGFQSFIVNKDNDSEFLYNWIIKNKKEFIRRASGSTFLEIGKSEIKKIKSNIPLLSEQQKIAAFLTAVDNKIEQLIKKQELLGEYKKGLMQQIFSQAIRFKADDGSDFPDWEEKKLGGVVDNVGGTALEKYTNPKETHKFISIGNYGVDGKYIDNGQRVELNNKTKTKLLDKDNLVMVLNDKTAAGNIVGSTILIDESDSYIYNQRSERLICKSELFPIFAWHYLNSKIFRKSVYSISQGGTQIYVNFPSVKELNFSLPSLLEQTKIANFLSSIDTKIEQVGKQLDESKQFKKALLQQMFV